MPRCRRRSGWRREQGPRRRVAARERRAQPVHHVPAYIHHHTSYIIHHRVRMFSKYISHHATYIPHIHIHGTCFKKGMPYETYIFETYMFSIPHTPSFHMHKCFEYACHHALHTCRVSAGGPPQPPRRPARTYTGYAYVEWAARPGMRTNMIFPRVTGSTNAATPFQSTWDGHPAIIKHVTLHKIK